MWRLVLYCYYYGGFGILICSELYLLVLDIKFMWNWDKWTMTCALFIVILRCTSGFAFLNIIKCCTADTYWEFRMIRLNHMLSEYCWVRLKCLFPKDMVAHMLALESRCYYWLECLNLVVLRNYIVCQQRGELEVRVNLHQSWFTIA